MADTLSVETRTAEQLEGVPGVSYREDGDDWYAYTIIDDKYWKWSRRFGKFLRYNPKHLAAAEVPASAA